VLRQRLPNHRALFAPLGPSLLNALRAAKWDRRFRLSTRPSADYLTTSQPSLASPDTFFLHPSCTISNNTLVIPFAWLPAGVASPSRSSTLPPSHRLRQLRPGDPFPASARSARNSKSIQHGPQGGHATHRARLVEFFPHRDGGCRNAPQANRRARAGLLGGELEGWWWKPRNSVCNWTTCWLPLRGTGRTWAERNRRKPPKGTQNQ